MKKIYFISRQVQFTSGTHIVEINFGGQDYANPDMISFNPLWPADGYETNDPRNAAEMAICLAKQWHKELKQTRKSKKDKVPAVYVGYGYTGGTTLPFEPCSFRELLEWGEREYEKLPKCRYCQEIMTAEGYGHQWTEIEGEHPFCSAHCAGHDEYRIMQENWVCQVLDACDGHDRLSSDPNSWVILPDDFFHEDGEGVNLYYKNNKDLAFRIDLKTNKVEKIT